ncbi:hypothetical protein H5T56_05805 [Candidatus Bipolaricaulota bacterium]|nr:hypothetical protein [Candidatus Bipolaricaulota bacterium]
MGRKILFWSFLILTWPLWAQSTSWSNPQADQGQFVFPQRAYYDDNQSALVFSPDEPIFHDYWGYTLPIPPGAQILGIEVRLDAWHWRFGWPVESRLWVELSWDGGQSWTSTGYGTGRLPLSETTFVLGGPSDLWGRASWSAEELAPGNFRVRVRGIGSARLDWVATRVYYRTGFGLTVEPRTINLGTLSLADYDRGYLEALAIQSVELQSPASWTLYIAATDAHWNYTGDLPDPQKPCGHLLWRVEDTAGTVSVAEKSYVPLAVANRMVAQGGAGVAKLSLSFRLLVDYDTTWPGIYSLHFLYTLVSS